MNVIQYLSQGFGRLMEQRKLAANLKSLIRASANQAQSVEVALFQLLDERGLDAALGVNLDTIGLIVGQPRGGRSDDDYRTRIYLRIIQNNSEGTAENLIAIITGLLAPSMVEFNENFPASFSITVMDPLIVVSDAEVVEAVQRAKAGGVNGDYVAHGSTPAFAFSGDSDPEKDGFGANSTAIDAAYNAWQAAIIAYGPTDPITIGLFDSYTALTNVGGQFVSLY